MVSTDADTDAAPSWSACCCWSEPVACIGRGHPTDLSCSVRDTWHPHSPHAAAGIGGMVSTRIRAHERPRGCVSIASDPRPRTSQPFPRTGVPIGGAGDPRTRVRRPGWMERRRGVRETGPRWDVPGPVTASRWIFGPFQLLPSLRALLSYRWWTRSRLPRTVVSSAIFDPGRMASFTSFFHLPLHLEALRLWVRVASAR